MSINLSAVWDLGGEVINVHCSFGCVVCVSKLFSQPDDEVYKTHLLLVYWVQFLVSWFSAFVGVHSEKCPYILFPMARAFA